MTDQNSSILAVKNLNVFYSSFQAVKDVSFHVQPGEIFGLLGPNGAGKTSSLSAIEGLLKPHSGNITVAGYDVNKQPLYAKANMGVQLQATSFQPELTITEIIKLFAGIYGVPLTSQKLNTILQDIKLEDLNKKSLEKIDEYLKTKDRLPQKHHEKVNDAKNKWQSAWVELMNTLMFLERLEI